MSKILGIFPKANEIGIFVYAGALFFFVVYVAINQINIDPVLVGVFGFILILLLYRYFHEIKFGGLSLRKDMTDNDNKFEAFKSSASTVINELQREFEIFKASASKTIIDLTNELDTFKTSSVEEIIELKKLQEHGNPIENNKKDKGEENHED